MSFNHYFDTFTETTSGKPRPGILVSVLKLDGTLATLASDMSGTPKGNPVTTDENGLYSFYIEDGAYNLVFRAGDTQIGAIANVPIRTGLDAAGARAASVENALGSSTSLAPSQAAVAAALIPKVDSLALSQPAGSGLVGFAQTGVGAVARTAQEKSRETVSVLDFGAKGDGTTDDTAAIQRALNTGADVFVPQTNQAYKISAPLDLKAVGQRIYGQGKRSLIRQIGTGSNATVLRTTLDECQISNLCLEPGSASLVAGVDGWGLLAVGCGYLIVERVRVRRMRRGGIGLFDVSFSRVTNCFFTDSVVLGDGTEPQSQTGYDVLMAGTSSFNLVEGNQCVSKCGTGVGCQTYESGKSQRGNIIRGNLIDGHPAYGAMAYLNDNNDFISDITIEGNVIRSISGRVSVPPFGGTQEHWFYGAGIYIQTCDNFQVIGNRLRGTCTDRTKPLNVAGVHAAIAVTGLGNGVVSDNIVHDSYDGIYSGQSLRPPGAVGDTTIIANNNISDVTNAGINLQDATNAIVRGNRVTCRLPLTSATRGIWVRRIAATWLDTVIIDGNYIRDAFNGIEVGTLSTAVPRVLIINNVIATAEANAQRAINSSAVETQISGNTCIYPLGIRVTSDVQAGFIENNTITATGGAPISDLGSKCTYGTNRILAQGAASENVVAVLPAGGSPNVSGRIHYFKDDASALTNLSGSSVGQIVTIFARSGFSVQEGALKLKGAANRTLAAGDSITLVNTGDAIREA